MRFLPVGSPSELRLARGPMIARRDRLWAARLLERQLAQLERIVSAQTEDIAGARIPAIRQ